MDLNGCISAMERRREGLYQLSGVMYSILAEEWQIAALGSQMKPNRNPYYGLFP